MRRQSWMFAAGLSLMGSSAAVAQERQSEVDPQQEAKEVVVRIRKSMREVNKLLLKGSDTGKAVEASEQVVRDLESLLQEAENSAESVVAGLDELMKIATQNSPPSGGGGQSQKPPDSSQQPQNDGAKREKSQDPQELAEQGKPQGSSEQEGQDQKDQKDPSSSGDQPQDSPQPDNSPGSQEKAGQAPPGAETGSFENEDTAGRWGVLPAKEAEDLQRHAVDEFPQRYRHWMDQYYKRVNRSQRR